MNRNEQKAIGPESNDGLGGMTGRDIIFMLRDIPTKCDVCGQDTDAQDLDPVSGGAWICGPCWEAEGKRYALGG